MVNVLRNPLLRMAALLVPATVLAYCGRFVANIIRNPLLRMAVFLVPATILTGTVFFFTGSRLTEAILPGAYQIITFLHPEYEFSEFQLSKEARPKAITFSVIVRRNPGSGSFVFGNVQGFPFSGRLLDSNTYVMPLITFSLLFAWPFISVYKKLAAFLISLPFLLFAELFDISLFVIGNIEAQSRSIIYVAGTDTLSYHISTFCQSFLNNGGRQFLAILVFLLAIAPFHLKARALPLRGTVRGNDPCPCGSGKKFKKCCGR